MDGDGFDADGFDGNGNVWASHDSFAGANAWSQQPSASGPGHGPPARGGFDLNSQAAAADEFPSLRQYGAFLQGDLLLSYFPCFFFAIIEDLYV